MNKGQAALEFLTTYGWAVLMLVIAIGVMSYAGFLNPSKILPERCSFPPEIICEDHVLTASGFQVDVKLRHNMGKTIIINNATCVYRGGVTSSGSITGDSGGDWAPKTSIDVHCAGSGSALLIAGQKDKVEVVISYKKKATGYDHELTGELYGEVV